MSESTKERVIDQLCGYISQLRALPPPEHGLVASLTGGPIWEPAMICEPRLGPFSTNDEFHDCLRHDIPLSIFDKNPSWTWAPSVVHAHSLKYETKATHGDLAGRNILCKADGTITCILDWETSGWYPEYWEYTKARYFPSNGPDWIKRIGLITGEYPDQFWASVNVREHITVDPPEHYIYKEK
ncbi:hypothetical protein BDN70DRAFT_852448 [Pholiota conissans]|uniref:Aminoglycoside phosphotransferase domain-containing protein n=1 Tax=Pholiota conissans TaxID=109636 RepID=A0A9P5Z8E8_9AGAR|nr:hypothetical protein BDN70DRAFT_852448 [Pholiota conissans]